MRLESPYVPLALVAVMLAAFALLTVLGGPQLAWTACRDAVLGGLRALAMWPP
jgi:hypothetical protein